MPSMICSTAVRSGICDWATSVRHIFQSSATELTRTVYLFDRPYLLSA